MPSGYARVYHNSPSLLIRRNSRPCESRKAPIHHNLRSALTIYAHKPVHAVLLRCARSLQPEETDLTLELAPHPGCLLSISVRRSTTCLSNLQTHWAPTSTTSAYMGRNPQADERRRQLTTDPKFLSSFVYFLSPECA